jgi:hypothetical protein
MQESFGFPVVCVPTKSGDFWSKRLSSFGIVYDNGSNVSFLALD